MHSVISQVRETAQHFENPVDRNSILRKKEFVVEENDLVKSIVHINVDEALDALIANPETTDAMLIGHHRLDTHVLAFLRYKKPFEGTRLPFIGSACAATHADIHESGNKQRRVKVRCMKNGIIQLDAFVTFRAGAEVRLMNVERAQSTTKAVCRVCNTYQVLPVFHGVPGICHGCNSTKVNPAKKKMGGHLLWLLLEGMFFEEIGPRARFFKKEEIEKTLGYENKIFTVLVKGQEIPCYQDNNGDFKEAIRNKRLAYKEFKIDEEIVPALDEKNEPILKDGVPQTIRVKQEQTENGRTRYRMNGKWYIQKLHKWAEGLEKKMAELRTNKNGWIAREYSGIFSQEDCFEDQTLMHMRRMFNIARAKQHVDGLFVTNQNIEQMIDEIQLVFDQPDCSRQLYSIVKDKLENIMRKGNFQARCHEEWAKKAVIMLTVIQNGMDNTGVAHA